MPKEIVQIGTDPALNIIKAFRVANKRAGEAKAQGPDGMQNYLQFCAVIRDLKNQAVNMGFQIWVMQGKTGHTYGKDYRETPDEMNNFETYQAWRTEREAARNAARMAAQEANTGPDDNVIDPTLVSDEDDM